MDKRAILTKLNYMKMDLEKLSEDTSTWEDRKVKSIVEVLIEQIEDVECNTRYYCKESKTGRLYKQNDGRYAIDQENYFTCGSALEMLLYDSWEEKEVWCAGRVESKYTDNGQVYYFLNKDGDNKDLEEGDLVRVRI